jgi:hypothetical protein
MAITASKTVAAPAVSSGAFWTGWGLTGLIVLFLLFDAFGKFARPVQVTDAFVKLGIPISQSVTIGSLLVLCTVLYAIPRTAVLGAVLLTGYLGGAVAIQMRVNNPLFETIFPVLFAGVAWLAIYLRSPRLRSVVPLC